MSQHKNKKKDKKKKEINHKKDTNPSGNITIGEVVEVSETQGQRKKSRNKNNSDNKEKT